MTDTNEPPQRYYYRHKLNTTQINHDTSLINTRIYLNRLTALQIFSTCVIFIASCLQGIAIGTTDWFVLNVNEFVPTSKGGLWNYCYVSSTGLIGQYTCLKYEELPNFAIFVNSRLYDSRILLLCSAGFCLLIFLIEIFGIFCLSFAESRGDLIDTLVAKSSSSPRKTSDEQIYSSNKSNKSSKTNGLKNDEASNSARFTTSIIVNSNSDQTEVYKTLKPTGYYAYLIIALITLVGSVMDFVLKVSGFALFDTYMTKLLSFNTVFLAYRSYSYWMMVVSIALMLFYWLFKVFSTKYVLILTKQLVKVKNNTPTLFADSVDSDQTFDQFPTSKF